MQAAGIVSSDGLTELLKNVQKVFKGCVTELQKNCQCKIIPVLLNWKGSLRNASMKILHFQEIQSGVLISSFRGLRDQETRPPRLN